MNDKVIERLQFITFGADADAHYEQTVKACEGGCRWVQLRIKGFDERIWSDTVLKAKEVTDKFKAKLIVNDNVDIAKETGASGVHLGKDDLSVSEARQILGNDFIIGGTANTFSDIVRVSSEGADYVGLGPYRFTTTKKKLSPVLGIRGYSAILEKVKRENIHIPVIAIGGITEDDISLLLQAGLYGIAVSSVIANADDITLKTMTLIDKIKKHFK